MVEGMFPPISDSTASCLKGTRDPKEIGVLSMVYLCDSLMVPPPGLKLLLCLQQAVFPGRLPGTREAVCITRKGNPVSQACSEYMGELGVGDLATEA